MNRALSMLGLCARAGKLISGEKACLQAIRSGSAHAVILDSAAAKNAEKSVQDACAHHQVRLIRTEAFALGDAIGKPGRMAVAITDRKMAEHVIHLFETL